VIHSGARGGAGGSGIQHLFVVSVRHCCTRVGVEEITSRRDSWLERSEQDHSGTLFRSRIVVGCAVNGCGSTSR